MWVGVNVDSANVVKKSTHQNSTAGTGTTLRTVEVNNYRLAFPPSTHVSRLKCPRIFSSCWENESQYCTPVAIAHKVKLYWTAPIINGTARQSQWPVGTNKASNPRVSYQCRSKQTNKKSEGINLSAPYEVGCPRRPRKYAKTFGAFPFFWLHKPRSRWDRGHAKKYGSIVTGFFLLGDVLLFP